jgi:hypothetical protein
MWSLLQVKDVNVLNYMVQLHYQACVVVFGVGNMELHNWQFLGVS